MPRRLNDATPSAVKALASTGELPEGMHSRAELALGVARVTSTAS